MQYVDPNITFIRNTEHLIPENVKNNLKLTDPSEIANAFGLI